MSNLTQQQRRLLDFIQTFMKENGWCPSYVEMGEYMDLRGKSNIHRLVSCLEERGFVRRRPRRARSLELVVSKDVFVSPPAMRVEALSEFEIRDTIKIAKSKIASGFRDTLLVEELGSRLDKIAALAISSTETRP